MAKRTWIFGKECMRFMDPTQDAQLRNARGNRGKPRSLPDAKVEAARRRLRECMDAAETLEAIREIVSNLLGCETMHLLRFDCKTGELSPFWSFGIHAANRSMIDALDEPASYCAALGSTYIARDLEVQCSEGHHPKLNVFVPIRFRGEVTAVLALPQFLPQKLGFDKIDNEIFQLLSEEAGRMLFYEEADAAAAKSPEPKL